MSEKTIETRVTDVEKSVAKAHENDALMIEMANGLALFQKTVAIQLFNWIVALDARNSEAFQVLKKSLPDKASQQKISDILARNVFDRDQLEEMIKKVETLPPFGKSES